MVVVMGWDGCQCRVEWGPHPLGVRVVCVHGVTLELQPEPAPPADDESKLEEGGEAGAGTAIMR
jgi:hypothetical protein